ncbi:MAG: DUF2628 domain-containing protein [Oscillospiraceae bacterium]|nr:DUF2628 domain-containing protein [Oscillospiraceae bacterium]
MPNYTGCQCTVCQNTFRPEDDIVVCPDCGTPYHRSCYASKGMCINTALHASGQSWQELHRQKLEERECPNCRHINAPDAQYCSVCHTPMRNVGQDGVSPHINIVMPDGRTMTLDPNDRCCGMDPEEDLDGEKLGDVADFIGNNTLYYLPLFQRFKEGGKKTSINLPALLFPHLYFANRKMWLMTFLTVLVMTICGIPALLTSIESAYTSKETIEMYQQYGMDPQAMIGPLLSFIEANESLILSLDIIFYAVQLGLRVLLCIFANWLYYRHTLRHVRKIRLSGTSGKMKQMFLRSDGGSNLLNIFGAAGISIGMYFAAMCAILLPFMLL